MIRVAHLPANTRGRDIVAGDLHGHIKLLQRLLDLIWFDPSVDRLFLTGDLNDRGPASWECLQLLFEPWVKSVKGNHEDYLHSALLAAIAVGKGTGRLTRQELVDQMLATMDPESGMGCLWFPQWLKDHSDWTPLENMERAIDNLPHILTVGSGPTRFNVVHAELEAAGLASDALIDRAHGLEDDKLLEKLLWSRKLGDECDQQHLTLGRNVKNPLLSPTYCGHYSMPQVAEWKSHVFVDTGCGWTGADWMGLTGVCATPGPGEKWFVAHEEQVNTCW